MKIEKKLILTIIFIVFNLFSIKKNNILTNNIKKNSFFYENKITKIKNINLIENIKTLYENKKNSIIKNINIKNIFSYKKIIKSLNFINPLKNNFYNFLIKNTSVFNITNITKKKRIVNDIKFSNIYDMKSIIAIDAGHGGIDPGATSNNGLKEKNITISMAHKLKKVLDNDPYFLPILTRKKDNFLNLSKRSKMAKNNKAKLLISIHTNSSYNEGVKGSSILLLSKNRINMEKKIFLNTNKHGTELQCFNVNKPKNYCYIKKTILDIKFNNTLKTVHNLSIKILKQLKNTNNIFIHKNKPEQANLEVLKSPEIPSVLLETGFISNKKEEKLLSNNKFQHNFVKALYKSLCSFFKRKKYYY